MANNDEIHDRAVLLSKRSSVSAQEVVALSEHAMERARCLVLEGTRASVALTSIVRALGAPCFASFDEHAVVLLEVATSESAPWSARDAAVDVLIENHVSWSASARDVLEAIDDEKTPWGYRLVLTACCGAEGAQRLAEMLPRTRFDETRLRAKVQHSILVLADELDVTDLLDILYDGLRWDARASMIRELPARADLIPWVQAHIDADIELDVRRAALGWLAMVWAGEPAELEPSLADALLDPAFPDDLGERVAQSLAVHGTRASLEGLVAAATERQGAVRYAARLAIQKIEARLPVDQRVSGGLSISLEPELGGALSPSSGAQQGDLSVDADPDAVGALVPSSPNAGALTAGSRNDVMLARWTQIAPAPRKTPLSLRTAVGVWGGSWSFPAVWSVLALLNIATVLGILTGAGGVFAQFFASFWIYYALALIVSTFNLFGSKRRKALTHGRAHIASIVQREPKGSRWRIESTQGNAEFFVKGRKALGDTLPVLFDSGRGKITSRELAYFAEVDERGNLSLAQTPYAFVIALPFITYGSFIIMIALAIISIA